MKKPFCTFFIFAIFISLSFSQNEVVDDLDDIFIQQYDNQNDSRRNKFSGKINREFTKDLTSFTGDSIFIAYSYLFDFCNYADVRFINKSRVMGIANKIQTYNYSLYFNDIPIMYSLIKITEVNGEIESISCRSDLEDLSSIKKIDFSIIDKQIDWSEPVKNKLNSELNLKINDAAIVSEAFEVKYINNLEKYKLVKVIKARVGNKSYKMQFEVNSSECIQFKDLTNYLCDECHVGESSQDFSIPSNIDAKIIYYDFDIISPGEIDIFPTIDPIGGDGGGQNCNNENTIPAPNHQTINTGTFTSFGNNVVGMHLYNQTIEPPGNNVWRALGLLDCMGLSLSGEVELIDGFYVLTVDVQGGSSCLISNWIYEADGVQIDIPNPNESTFELKVDPEEFDFSNISVDIFDNLTDCSM